jgi:Protein of unknown function (DUF3295)/Fungal protein of unknown function (DUF1752)
VFLTVFSRCAGSLEEGRRLENLSWRLWNRETFCCEPGEANATTPAISIASRNSHGRYTADVPELSGSVDSLADEEAIEFDSEEATSTSAPVNISRPRIERQDSCGSTRSRGRERHITPDDLEKMVITIKEKKDLLPLEISTHSYLAPLANKPNDPAPAQVSTPAVKVAEGRPSPTECTAEKASPAVSSDSASAVSERSTTSVVRGFSPSHVSSSYRSIPLPDAPSSPSPIIEASITNPQSQTLSKTHQKKHPKFALGGSSQSGDDSFNEASSMDSQMQHAQVMKANAFAFGSSGEDESLLRQNMRPQSTQRSSLTDALRRPISSKKQTSFQDNVTTRTIPEERAMGDDVFETDEDDDIDESAIDDDDDSSDWEDSVEESGKSSIDDKTFFQRVDSRPNLTTRRSLITTMLHQNDRATALANAASRSTPAMQRSRTSSPNGPSLAASPDSDDAGPLMMKGLRPGQEVPRSAAQPIVKTATSVVPHQVALSPKTTRRNMLQTELTASLRRHLLWERQQKNQTATAVLKRRHTAHDVSNLRQYPERVHLGTDDKDNYGSWNQYFGQGLGDFHSKGW